jgi:hypothetical protein
MTLSTPSGRIGRVPTTFCNSFGIYVMDTLLPLWPHLVEKRAASRWCVLRDAPVGRSSA